jgi:hypothetical protein
LLRRVVTEGLFTKLVRNLKNVSFTHALFRWATARSEDCSSSLNYMYEGISCLGPTVLYLLNCTCTYTGGRRLEKRCEIAWNEGKPEKGNNGYVVFNGTTHESAGNRAVVRGEDLFHSPLFTAGFWTDI